MRNWDLDEGGKIAASMFMGFETAVVPMTGLVRIVYAGSEAEFEAGGTGLQLSMTAHQLREFAGALERMAETIERQPLGTAQ